MNRPFEVQPGESARQLVEERLGPDREPPVARRDLFDDYRKRLAGARKRKVPPWEGLGPKPLPQSYGGRMVEVSGRVSGIAADRDGRTVYLAAANGGVWRSDDGGGRWTFTMEGFDQDPKTLSSDTLACGAIALHPDDRLRIYLGTGEAATALYFGIGPVSTQDGGKTWIIEASSPSLAGKGFFELAVDPADPERVVAATTAGLYFRESPTAAGVKTVWRRVDDEDRAFTSVVVGRLAGATVFYAARRGGPVLVSDDGGATWKPLHAGFPSGNLGRISLALSGEDGSRVYALAANDAGRFHGIYLLDRGQDAWRSLAGTPTALFGDSGGNWAQAIAVDPNDPARFFIGGTAVEIDGAWNAALFRCRLQPDGRSLSHAYVGWQVHADVQALAFVPGRSDALWVATDGGVFFASNADASGHVFGSRNQELSTLTLNHLAEHQVGEEIVCGSHDNGCVRYKDGKHQEWETVFPGDCGFPVVHWVEPWRLLATTTYHEFAHVDGDHVEYVDPDELAGETTLFYAPLAGIPPVEEVDAATAHQANRVAFGTVRPWISDDFGRTWYSIPFGTLDDDRLGWDAAEAIRSLAFASYGRLYVGTEAGAVYRFDFDVAEAAWHRTPLSAPRTGVHSPLTAQAFRAPITDIVVDPGDPSRRSIYVTLGGPLVVGGQPSSQRLWHFDGASWMPRSGSPTGPVENRLLPVQHNAIAVDPRDPRRLWVGADIGVWYSEDRGRRWQPFQHGLPDAAVVDLRLHPKLRKLRAATHGLGLFEVSVDF